MYLCQLEASLASAEPVAHQIAVNVEVAESLLKIVVRTYNYDISLKIYGKISTCVPCENSKKLDNFVHLNFGPRI